MAFNKFHEIDVIKVWTHTSILHIVQLDKVGDIKLINFYTAMEKRKIKDGWYVAYDLDHVQDMQYSLNEEEIMHMTYVPISFNITWTNQMLWFLGTLFNFSFTKFNSIIELKRNGKANWWERYWKFTHEYGVELKKKKRHRGWNHPSHDYNFWDLMLCYLPKPAPMNHCHWNLWLQAISKPTST
jgi:hypothetical protein